MYAIEESQNFYNTKIFSFEGRLRRLQFFLTLLALTVAAYLISFGIGFVCVVINPAISEGMLEGLGLLVNFAFIYPVICAYIKRCRDSGLSPHWTWLLLVPVANLCLAVFLLFKPTKY